MHKGVSEIVNWVITALAMLLTLVVLARLLAKVFRYKFAPVKTVRAKVIKKHRQELFSQYAGTGRRYRYVVTFLAEGKGCLSMFQSFPLAITRKMKRER